MSDPVALSEAEIDDLTDGCDGQGEYLCCHRTIHKRTKEPVGGRMLDAVERILATRLAATDRDTALREAAAAIEADRPEMGLHINVTEYRRGLDDGMLKAVRILRAALDASPVGNES